ncbi:MAG TPA: multidrug ABC transporter ATP-binding protein, partial [Roseomonas sp.]
MPFRPLESFIDPIAPPGVRAAKLLGVEVPEAPPPRSLIGFYWHFARQARALLVAIFLTGFLVAVLDSLIPVFIGRVVALLGQHEPGALWAEAGGSLLWMGAVLLVLRPA